MFLLDYIFVLISWFVGLQFYKPEMNLLRGKYNYKIQKCNTVTYVSAIILFVILLLDILNTGWIKTFLCILCSFVFSFISEFIISKLNISNVSTWILRMLFVIVVYYSTSLYAVCLIVPAIMGIYTRNCIFGVPYGKKMFISSYMKRTIMKSNGVEDFVNNNRLIDYSFAGNNRPINNKLKRYNVVDYGIYPNTNYDCLHKTQNLIEKVGKNGGGIIYFPKGNYLFNNRTSCLSFLQINYSNIIIEGELDANGKPIANLISCKSTVNGKKYPWLSPFFITTGETIQESNIFWGLNFKNDKHIRRQSDSLSDPGSDGRILSPKFTTKIIADALTGSDIIEVEDSSKVGKYILLGLYNTTEDGNLIKEILGVNELRPEWMTAHRAGIEKAPSFQWLVEVVEKIDKHKIRLCRPLFRDCLMKYTPEVFNVEMLENIAIRNIKLSSKWNGMFHHHGFFMYYNVKQSQDMDYGWNGINLKRVAHANVANVIFENFSNPIYLFDSRNVTVNNVVIKGYDGHQGLKIYMHACDNLYKDITFLNHYADMIGGEGNAYCNVFCNITYLNPNFKPAQFDFHGFSEGPMSPPAYNIFDNVYGFKNCKMAGAIYNQPACAQYNAWYNVTTEGEKIGEPFFEVHYLRNQSIIKKNLSSIKKTIVYAIHNHIYSSAELYRKFKNVKKASTQFEMPKKRHHTLFVNSYLLGIVTKCTIDEPHSNIHIENINKRYKGTSIYEQQKMLKNK